MSMKRLEKKYHINLVEKISRCMNINWHAIEMKVIRDS